MLYPLYFFLSILLLNACADVQKKEPVIDKQSDLRDIVLVHGSWGGEWSWSPVHDRLASLGHNVYSVSLKGHGKRSAENGPDVTLADHRNDIIDVIKKNNLDSVIIVMHSYGGLPGTHAWDSLGTRIAHAIYVDARAPSGPDDDPFLQLKQRDKNRITDPEILKSGLLPFRGGPHPKFMPQSLKTYNSDLKLKNWPPNPSTKKTYILATKYKLKGQSKPRNHLFYDALIVKDDWNVFSFPTGHNVMLDAPDILTSLILADSCPNPPLRWKDILE